MARRNVVVTQQMGQRGGTLRLFSNGKLYSSSTSDYQFEGSTTMESDYHDIRQINGKQNVGGDWYLRKKFYFDSGPGKALYTNGMSKSSLLYNEYEGDFVPWAGGAKANSLLYPAYSPNINYLMSLGTQAIARSSPSRPSSSVSTLVGEIGIDGMPALKPALIKTRLQDFRSLGNDYLNVQFGWVPFVNELYSIAAASERSAKVLKDWRSNSGKNVRRRMKLSSESESTETLFKTGWHPSPFHPSLFTNGSSPLYLTSTRKIERWFSGCFTYYLPVPESTYGKIVEAARDANRMYGVIPTPSTLWELAPWTWAADWFGNIGSVMSNFSDFLTAGQVVKWAYVMEHALLQNTYTLPGCVTRSHGPLHLTQTFGIETKTRVGASPFGFGLTWNEFSPYQLSILAALGISRA